MIPDQRKMWDKKHAEGEHSSFRDQHSTFASLAETKFTPNSYILELGCGVGRDADFFATRGHQVLATDFSKEIVKQNRQIFKKANLDFDFLDMTKSFPFKEATFDVIYANLSIHYFPHNVVQEVISEIVRILKPKGLFCFVCKSPNDSYYGDGQEIESNFFISKKGHARHFFSKQYARDLTKDAFNLEMLDEITESYIGRQSTYVRCIAKKL